MGRGGSTGELEGVELFSHLSRELAEHPLGSAAAFIAMPDFFRSYLEIEKHQSYSGTKLHIFCENSTDVLDVGARVMAIVDERGLGMKAATGRFFAKTQPGAPQWGKGIVVYLPRRATLDSDTQAIVEALADYSKAGEIAGSEHVSGAVWKRRDTKVDLGRDFVGGEHREHYIPSEAYLADQRERSAREIPEGAVGDSRSWHLDLQK